MGTLKLTAFPNVKKWYEKCQWIHKRRCARNKGVNGQMGLYVKLLWEEWDLDQVNIYSNQGYFVTRQIRLINYFPQSYFQLHAELRQNVYFR